MQPMGQTFLKSAFWYILKEEITEIELTKDAETKQKYHSVVRL